MKKRVIAVIALIVYLALIVGLTLNGLPGRDEYQEKFGTVTEKND